VPKVEVPSFQVLFAKKSTPKKVLWVPAPPTNKEQMEGVCAIYTFNFEKNFAEWRKCFATLAILAKIAIEFKENF
jgi:hypothetical protein